jgi:hypothetical protein
MSILEEPAVRGIAEKLDAKFMEISAGFARTGRQKGDHPTIEALASALEANALESMSEQS